LQITGKAAWTDEVFETPDEDRGGMIHRTSHKVQHFVNAVTEINIPYAGGGKQDLSAPCAALTGVTGEVFPSVIGLRFHNLAGLHPPVIEAANEVFPQQFAGMGHRVRRRPRAGGKDAAHAAQASGGLECSLNGLPPSRCGGGDALARRRKQYTAGHIDKNGCLASATAEGIDIAALSPQTRDEERSVGKSGKDVRVGIGETDHKADIRGTARRAESHIADEFENPATAGQGLLFNVGRSRIGSHGEEVKPLPFIAEEGLHGVVAEEGIEGDGIAVPRFEDRAGVVFLGLADIAALGIEEDGNPARDGRQDLLQKGDAAGAEGFKVSNVRLEAGRVRSAFGNDAEEEFFERLLDQIRAGIESHAKMGADGGDAGGEFFRVSHEMLEPVKEDPVTEGDEFHATGEFPAQEGRIEAAGFEEILVHASYRSGIEEDGIDGPGFRDLGHRQTQEAARGCGKAVDHDLP
jgi:hypothetical protein